MKNSPLKSFAIITVCLLLATFAVCSIVKTVEGAEPSEPHPANALWAEPSTKTIDNTTVNLGYMFNITVWLNITDPALTWQVFLYFNNTYFNATRTAYTNATLGRSDFFADHSTMPVTPIIDNAAGTVLHGETLLGAEGVSGYGSLIWVEFNLTEIPPQNHLTINFTSFGEDTFILNPDLTDITLETVNGTDIPVIPEFPQMIMLLIATTMSAVSVILTKKLRR